MNDGSSSISVCVRVRPFSSKEQLQLSSTYGVGPVLFNSDGSATSTPQPARPVPVNNNSGCMRKVLKVLDERILVFDPPESNAVASFQPKSALPMMGKKVKDIRFCFDRVFDDDCGQEEVYDGSAKELVGHVMNGFHSTVFAYGATGCGKTHTISGSETQPGIVFLIMKDLFARITAKSEDTDFSLSVSYLEIYNETIRDLLEPEKGALQLRESNGTATPANLSTKEPKDAFDVVEWITLGNQNRTVNATEANATSSRSHAVLRVTVTQKPKAGGLTDTQQSATLSVIDLAGSERASVTKNKGDRLIEGANINRSLLALGNCINALCDPRKRGHVPYRDSKLTRLLKQSLGGNCKTVMIVCVSPSSAHYDETHNTLQYANRAKEIKTKAIRNVISVDRHVAQYCQQIMQQAEQIELLKKQLAEKGSSSGGLEEHDEDARAVNAAKTKIHSSWDTGRNRQIDVERAQVEKTAVDSVLAIFQQWKATALSSVDIPSSPGSSTVAAASTLNLVRANCDSLISNMSAASTRLRSEIQAGAGAMDMYTSMATSLTLSMRSSRPSALPTFQLELKVLEGRLGAAVAEAREQGLREASKCQAKAMHAMCDARAKVGGAIDAAREEGGEAERALVRLSHGIDSANRDAFLALVAGGGTSGGSGGTKRDSGTRSPLADDMWTTKSPRAAMGGVGSAPSGQLSVGGQAPRPPVVSTFARRSPRKRVAFQSRKVDTSSSLKSSPKKRKEVQWRDETGDGWELEDVKWRSPSTPDVLGAGTSSSSSASPSFPAVTVTSAPSPAPVSAMWFSTSTLQHGATASAAEMMALKARSSSTLGALRTKPAASRLSPLPRVSEVNSANFFSRDSPTSSMPPPPVPSSSRTPFSDVGNSSITSTASSDSSFSHHSTSMAPTSSGLFAPIVSSSSAFCAPTPTSTAVADTPRRAAAARRRISNIGPLRSTKSTRRTSFITPPTPAGSSSTLPGATRKAARIPGGAPSIPQSARKSPRKLTSSSSAGVRRASMMAPTPTSFPGFGAKSAARIAARRESSMAAMGGTSAGGLLGGGRNSTDGLQAAGAALFSRTRDSPSTAGGKPTPSPSTHWR